MARQVVLLARNYGWKAGPLAVKAKLSLATVENLYRGQTLNPHNKTLDAILKVLGHSRKIELSKDK